MDKKILTIVTFYYPPEKGAAANRMSMMASEFRKYGFEIQVICPLPNYPDGKIKREYRNKLYVKELVDGILIWRLPIYPSNSKSGVLRMLSMFSFAIPLFLFLILKSNYGKNILIQCPPLPVSLLAVLASKITSKNIILNVSDLWPLTAKDLGAVSAGIAYDIMDFMARFSYLNSNKILGQSNEIIRYIHNNYVQKPSFLFRNIQSNVDLVSEGVFNGRIIYAGLIGHAQQISTIVEKCKFPNGFEIYGAGGDTDKLIDVIKKEKLTDVSYNGLVSVKQLSEILPMFSYSLIPLSNPIHGAVPSKLFDAVSRGIPVIFMGGGEGADIVLENNLGYIVEPGNFGALNEVLLQITKEAYKQHYLNCLRFTENNLSYDKQFGELIRFIK